MSIFTSEVDANITNSPLTVDGSGFTQPVSGTVSVGNFPATQDVNVTSSVEVEVKNDAGSPVPISGTVTTTPTTSSSATVTQITSTAVNQTLLAANGSRKKAILYFNSGIWDVKFGATASTTSRTMRISTSNTTVEVDIWTGIIDAICTTSGKLVDVTELV